MMEAMSGETASWDLVQDAAHRWRCGRAGDAVELLCSAMLAYPHDTALYAAYQPIAEWHGRLRFMGFPLVISIAETWYLLEPLGPHHMQDFLATYDAETARLCCLPYFEDEDQWLAWYQQQQEFRDQLMLAIIDPGSGTIGMICLVAHGSMGFLFYWLGEAYRGKGIVTNAARALLERAAQDWGLKTFYAKAFRCNSNSHAVLERLGFEALPFPDRQPQRDEVFFRNGGSADEGQIAIELDMFMAAIGSDSRPWFLALPRSN